MIAPESHQLVNQNSGDVEIYTPADITAAARDVMGGIDLDPASSSEANKIVGASRYFDIATDGIKQEWRGRVWLNHPFGRPEAVCPTENCPVWQREFDRLAARVKLAPWDSDEDRAAVAARVTHKCHPYPLYGNKAWIDKAHDEFWSGRAEEILMITFNSSSEAWFQPLLRRPQFVFAERTEYVLTGGREGYGATKGSVVTYWGANLARFAEVFTARFKGELKVVYGSCQECGEPGPAANSGFAFCPCCELFGERERQKKNDDLTRLARAAGK